jgi:hypothetical protein
LNILQPLTLFFFNTTPWGNGNSRYK